MPREDISINTEKVELHTGDSPGIRVGIGMGFTREIDGVWIKPQIYIELNVPKDYTLEGYMDNELKPHLQFRLHELLEELMTINGLGGSDDK